MKPEIAARAWVDAWDRAWRAKDETELAPVYGDDVVYRSHPDRDPQPPLDYARAAFADEGDDLELWWGEPLVAGNRAAVEWWAALTESGELVTLAGTSWLTFGDDGRVVEQHDYWTITPARAAPWEGWGTSSSAA
ncbi:MAG: nuclear transport factor 2 family protein [Actinomycetota bacterium]|nr:nuclear transport factor 2 family protein [Actinomycetota bacterium]